MTSAEVHRDLKLTTPLTNGPDVKAHQHQLQVEGEPPKATGESSPGEMTAEQARLLLRHRPLLIFDSQDDYRPLRIESIVDNPGNLLKRNLRVLAGTDGEGGRQLDLDLLGTYPAKHLDRLVEAPRPVAAARRLQSDPRYVNRIYGRVCEDGRLWLQYWIWFYYHPSQLLGAGRHEGDWRVIQVGLDRAKLQPELLVLGHGQALEGEVRKSPTFRGRRCDKACADSCYHPLVYVAPFSHALYAEPGTHVSVVRHVSCVRIENPDGSGPEVLPEVEEFGAWNGWPGYWGGGTPVAGFGVSTRGPSHQKQWDPGIFARKVSDRKPLDARWLWKLGKRTTPQPPGLDRAVLIGRTVAVDFHLRRSRLRRPRWLFLTVHDRDAEDRVIRKRVVRAKKSLTTTRIPLRDGHPQNLTVRVTAFNRFRQRSEASPACVSPASAGDKLPDWPPGVLRRFHRALIAHLEEQGANSLEELRSKPFHLLELGLDRHEIVTVLESARRQRLVEPLDRLKKADGCPVVEDEWIPTEQGLLRTRRLTQFASGAVKALPLAFAAALVTTVLKTIDVTGVSNHLFAISLAAASAVFLFSAVIFFLFRRSLGATRKVLASNWDRHAVELPLLNRSFKRTHAPIFLALLVIVLVNISFVTGPNLGPVAVWVVLAMLIPIQTYLTLGALRTATLKREAAEARDVSVEAPMAAAPEPENPES